MIANTVLTENSNVFSMPDYRKLLSQDMVDRIREVGCFSQGHYASLDIPDTLTFYTDRYIKQLFDFSSVNSKLTIVDVGTGFGWLSMAFAFSTEAKIIAVELNEVRLKAAQEIAGILGIADRIDWRLGGLGNLPLADKEADIVYCIEVLEHVYRAPEAIRSLCNATSDLLILTTPNLWFPVIAHDTQLPLCHWLPVPLRKVYAKFFNREDRENDNLFWSPYSLRKNVPGFKPVSKWLHYSSYKNYLDTFPFYLPYGSGFYVRKIGILKKTYYDIASRFGMFSHWLVPSLAYVFKGTQ